ncbi:MAG: hypothetical protein D5R97_06620 [Candidatus Syntrophonatronum acetioxidans]|uniref:Uncharacterized protein n=1 Tax=Candidatus Syntrophonatronum acetioxidans TaxID=1795816 RepID=A0A424YDR4_9FIRM|nr:MAG: hypothetical protein D5R97_06620 [Candidatus Syntrophonatronum acetioxidans]
MHFILWFLKLRFTIHRNSFWRDTKVSLRTLTIAAVVIGVQALLTFVFYRFIFRDTLLDTDLLAGMLLVFFTIAVIWIYLLSFVQSINNFVRNFLQSPEINYLVSIPVPSSHIFLAKFFDHISSNAMSSLFLFYPFLAAIGVWANAPWFYYLAIIPLYILVSIIPSAIGFMVAMVGVRIVPAKTFTAITTFFSFVISISFAIQFSRVQEAAVEQAARFLQFLGEPLSAVIPVTGGIRLFYFLVFGEGAGNSLLLLLLFSALFIFAAFSLSSKLYFEGWVKHKSQESAPTIKAKPAVVSDDKVGNEIFQWIILEWKMAIRNKEMFYASLFMLFFFIFSTFVFIYTGFWSEEPLLVLYTLITVAAIFNIMAVSLPFIPSDIKTDKSLWKKRYWLLKVFPIEGAKIFNIQCLMYFIPGYIISLMGIVLFAVINGLSLPIILLAALSLLLILYGSAAVYTSTEMLSITSYFENNEFIGNVMTLVLPLLYGLISAGFIALYLAEELVAQIVILSSFSKFLSLPTVLFISAAAVLVAFFLSRTIYVKVWEQLEI